MEPQLHLHNHFEFENSCNRNRCFCCFKSEPEEFWINSKGNFEPWSDRRGDVTARIVANERLKEIVKDRIIEGMTDRGAVYEIMMKRIGQDIDDPITKDLLKHLMHEAYEIKGSVHKSDSECRLSEEDIHGKEEQTKNEINV